MKFNYSSTCANPALVERIMREFLQAISTLTCTDEETEGEKIRSIVLIKGTQGFKTNLDPNNPADIEIEYDFDSLTWKDKENQKFNRNFYTRCPIARGFADITLTLLHELGHNETFDLLPDSYDRLRAVIKIALKHKKNLDKCIDLYFNLPDEYLATQWAIDWLQDPEHQKIAKRFERKFFAAWRENA